MVLVMRLVCAAQTPLGMIAAQTDLPEPLYGLDGVRHYPASARRRVTFEPSMVTNLPD